MIIEIKKGIDTMRCPNCGSTAQVRPGGHETFVWKDTISIYLFYKCGCGCSFVSRIRF